MADIVFDTGLTAATASGTLVNGATVIKCVAVLGAKPTASDKALATLTAVDGITSLSFGTDRVTLTSVTKTTDTTNHRVAWDAANITLPARAETALGLLIYDATTDTNDGTRIPIAFYDSGFGSGVDLTSGGASITVTDFIRLASA